MAYVRKRLDSWEVSVNKKGFPRRSRTFNTKADAEKWARQIEAEMDRGVFVSRKEAENTTLSEALDRYERDNRRSRLLSSSSSRSGSASPLLDAPAPA